MSKNLDFQKTSNIPTVLDLFCGAGGMSWGFQMAGYSIEVGIDTDFLACKTHSRNINGKTLCMDLRSISDPLRFYDENGFNPVDIIIGGPPCQGFSRVGRGKLRHIMNDRNFIHDPRNQYYREFIRFVKALKPLYFVIENVPDMEKYEDGEGLILDKIEKELKGLGYITDHRVLKAEEYGVPQRRRRLFIVGNRLGQPITWPEQTHGPDREYPFVTVWDAIGDLPVVGIKHRKDVIPYVPRCELNLYQELMREGCDGVLYNHQTRWHNDQDLEAFTLLPEGGKYKDLPDQYKRYRDDIFKDKYRKLIRSEPSWTVEAHLSKDTYRHIFPSRVGDPEPPRTISVREAARLQSFPDSFFFEGPFTKKFYQVGNAVPPLLAKALAETIKPFIFGAKR